MKQQPNPTQKPLYPQVYSEDVFWGCYVSGIGENHTVVSVKDGDTIEYSDVCIGDKVDMVYNY